MNYIFKSFGAFREFLERLHIPGGLKLWVTCLSIAFIGMSVYRNFGKLSQQSIDSVTLMILFLSFFISCLSLLVNAIAWKKIIEWLGYKKINLDIISLFLRSNILKYLPGGVWHFVERVRVLKKNIGSEKAFLSVLIEPFFMIIGALFWVALGEFELWISIICLMPFLFLISRFRNILISQLDRVKSSLIQKISSKGLIEDYKINSSSLSHKYPFSALFMEIIFIGLRFFSFWLCLTAFSLGSTFQILHWSALFSIAWIVGLIVPSAPGGVGIFEACLLLIIDSSVSESGLISALLFYRILVSAADLFVVLIAPKNIESSGLSFS